MLLVVRESSSGVLGNGFVCFGHVTPSRESGARFIGRLDPLYRAVNRF
jgi:hypothetical protein